MATGGVRIRVGSHCEGRSPGGISGSASSTSSRKAAEKFYVRVRLDSHDIPPSQTYISDLTTEMLTSDAKVTI